MGWEQQPQSGNRLGDILSSDHDISSTSHKDASLFYRNEGKSCTGQGIVYSLGAASTPQGSLKSSPPHCDMCRCRNAPTANHQPVARQTTGPISTPVAALDLICSILPPLVTDSSSPGPSHERMRYASLEVSPV